MQILNDGMYTEIDGRPAVRFERSYASDMNRVWAAISDPADLRGWFPSPEVEYDARVGGNIRLWGDPYDPEGSTGVVRAWEPPRRFDFDWGTDELRFTVTPTGEGCRLELLNLLSTPGGAARNAAGWDFCLASLAQVIDGDLRDGAESQGEAALAAFIRVLEAYVAKGLPDDGWRPGDDPPPQG